MLLLLILHRLNTNLDIDKVPVTLFDIRRLKKKL